MSVFLTAVPGYFGVFCVEVGGLSVCLSVLGRCSTFNTWCCCRFHIESPPKKNSQQRGDHSLSYGLLLVLWVREDLRVDVGGCTKVCLNV